MGPSVVGGQRWTSIIAWTFLSCVTLFTSTSAYRRMPCISYTTGTIYDYEIYNINGTTLVDWSQYQGKVVLIVVVASFSRNTYQYPALNELQNSYDQLKVLGVPCNQFAFQEPGANATEILNSLYYVRPGNGYTPNFELTTKVDVNGNEHPLFSFIVDACPPAISLFEDKDLLEYDYMMLGDIRWSFEKVLIDGNGVPIARYSEDTQPYQIAPDISSLLSD